MKDYSGMYYTGLVILLNVLFFMQSCNRTVNTNRIIQTLKAMQVYSVNK